MGADMSALTEIKEAARRFDAFVSDPEIGCLCWGLLFFIFACSLAPIIGRWTFHLIMVVIFGNAAIMLKIIYEKDKVGKPIIILS